MRRFLYGLILIATALYVVIAAWRFVAPSSWPAELLVLFHPAVAIAGVVLLLISILFRRGFAQVVLAFAVGIQLMPLFVSTAPIAATAATSNFTVISANVLQGTSSQEAFLDLVEAEQPDVIVLQEVNGDWSDLVAAFPGYPNVASPWATPQGVVVLSRYPLTAAPIPGVEEPRRNAGGSLGIRAVATTPEGPVVVYGIHAPTPQSQVGLAARTAYLLAVGAAIEAEPAGTHVVLAGDWNTPPWSPIFSETLDRGGLFMTETSAWPAPTRIIRRYDIFRWLGSPVDHIAVSRDIARESFVVGPDIGSDHKPIIARLLLQPVGAVLPAP